MIGVGSWVVPVAAATLVVVGLLWLLRAARTNSKDGAVRPFELLDADLIYSERRFEISAPVWLSVRLDRAYLLRSGLAVLMELKTRRRSRVFVSDVVQLSAQALVLERATGHVVARQAYVLVQMPDGRREPHRVQLLPEEAVIGLVRRREAILAGQLEPRSAASPTLCKACAYRGVCPDRADR
nr:PD-(D/E)XK nuclease family protein [uncultured Roseateles sp.]